MKKTKNVNKNLMLVICINVIIFCFSNFIFDIKYEQVDDFIIYNLYSGLDGTYNFHGIYVHPLLCIILSTLFKFISTINWHSIFLLSMQFICFTIIGYNFLEKHKNAITILLYTIFASIFYTTLLVLIQYTSVSALLILTSFYMLLHDIEKNKSKKYKILYVVLYALGIMLRMQSILIVIPFIVLYGIYYFIKYKKGNVFIKLIKIYAILGVITGIIYISNTLIYEFDSVYKEFIEYNKFRSTLQDLSYIEYDENKELFDEIGWTKNDHYLFFTFNTGDENVYNKESLGKIIDYKIKQNEYYKLNLDVKQVFLRLINEMTGGYTLSCILYISIFILSLINNKSNRKINILIFLITTGIHILFIILNRSLVRVVIPEYVLGTILIMDNMKFEYNFKKEIVTTISIILISVISALSGTFYNLGYKLEDYSNYQEVINYTNDHKENVYLYTIPSLQYRYLAYSVYCMPPKGSFSNLRVMGGWDMYTENYYDFKERYNLDGTFLDVLKDNVYVIDGDVYWSGKQNKDYIKHIAISIKEHYNIDVKYEKIKEFDNIYIYKITKK